MQPDTLTTARPLFSTQGNAFRINDQAITGLPILLVIHDRDYIPFVAAGETYFSGKVPYAYLGTSPWPGSPTNDATLPFLHPLNIQITDYLLSQGEYGVILYALTEKTMAQEDFIPFLRRLQEKCPKAAHILVQKQCPEVCQKTGQACHKDTVFPQKATRNPQDKLFSCLPDLPLMTYATDQEAKELFKTCMDTLQQSSAPLHYDHLNREHAEWSNYSVTLPLTDAGNRILLVGDSISAGYGPMVQDRLPDYHVDRFHTSEGLHHPGFFRLLEIALLQYPYQIIHLNNGIHIHGQTVGTYAHNLTALFQWIHMLSPRTRILFSATTPASRLQEPGQENVSFQSSHFQLGDRSPLAEMPDQKPHYVYSPEASSLYQMLNEAARQVCHAFGIPFLDLFDLSVRENLPKSDQVHFQEPGYGRLADLVAETILQAVTK